MTPKQFEEILTKRIQRIRDTLGIKAQEYVQGEDRLYNFKKAAEIRRCMPAQALAGMMVKHEVSVHDLVDFPPSSDMDAEAYLNLIDEKIGDNINYLILLEALLKEGLKCE